MMGNLLQFPFTDSDAGGRPSSSSAAMSDAPRDGRVIWVMVAGPSDEERRAGRKPEHKRHWLGYPIRWHEGRWCYARRNTPTFPWHEPLMWQEEKPECLE